MNGVLTGAQIRRACELLEWTRYDLRRATALPFDVVDRLLAADDGIETTLAREIVVREALRRAGIDFVAEDGGVRLRNGARSSDEAGR